MIGNVVVSDVNALMHVVPSKAEKHVPCDELVGTTECITLYPRCRTNLGRYNRFPPVLKIGTSMTTAIHRLPPLL